MIEQVLPANLGDWFARDAQAKPLLLDVREPWEVQTASVKPLGYTLLAIPMNEIPARLSELGPYDRIACLCHHGTRSQHVASFLHQRGISSIANVAGGIDAWSRQVDPSVPRY
ncbi:rhodanese-like domain-containing protein [Variovorax dokdonensis]|uniref:Rhodanese-like domain-containing protein n=1 Tax=Variovorax dokdonensis TaxID=344883 RepID=A0ABT7N7F6_9BURK|nr:rhodanese-like domain-containing protein [Variovorax dokdonensis]MDM0043879.1 rhodanese-like domain-containing protein [Variovorax dokdonensis]